MVKKTILLVEDDDVVRDMIRGALEREYQVIDASECSEAIRQIKNHFDLALIDYDLPDGDGFDVLRAMRKVKPGLPVIFMTAYSTENLAIKALHAAVTSYIKKPLSFAYLRGKLSEILEGKEYKEASESAETHEVFIVDSIAAFIEENYKEDLTRDALARRARMEKHRFSRVFKKRYGKGVKSYINTVRITRAAELLSKNIGLSIADVAISVGYGGIQHFDKMFKQVHGVSPNAYRKKQYLLPHSIPDQRPS